MSNEKPHTDEARKSVHRNCVSAVASVKRCLSTCSALSRQMGATRHTGCSLPPRAPACNLFPHLVARHVTIVFQLYPIVLFVFFCKKSVFFYIQHFSFSLIRDRIEA